jgi:hypothetical protein
MGFTAFEPNERSLGTFVVGAGANDGPVRRWDGAARTCHEWDELKRVCLCTIARRTVSKSIANIQQDPELWFRNGNCLVHLYEKGQSRRGPSFKLPFKDLLDSKCFPLIERFYAWAGPGPRSVSDFDRWSQLNPRHTVELYIPPPPAADKNQTFAYHIATRNFFAWVFRRSMVGSHLGEALVGLLHSMHEFRYHMGDNMDDILDFMDEEGYLDIANQPNHALAVLHFAESFQMKDLYTRAFAHCVGMSDRLFASPEYENVSLASRKLIRKAAIDMECRVYAATDKLRNFLDEELSEAHLGLPSGARAHLERFRSFLLSHYATRLGYYPPLNFDPSLFNQMRRDFEALYGFLVDESHSVSYGMPSIARGGICTLQLIQSLDGLYQYEPLEHPLPLLPELNSQASGSWGSLKAKLDKSKARSGDRRAAHSSLVRASNWNEAIFRNDLVRAYRRFEEETVLSPNKADKQEKVSIVDARKVRWIVIYTAFQVLRSVTEIPSQVYDAEAANYHLAVSVKNLPPWDEEEEVIPFDRLLRRQTSLAMATPPIVWADSAGVQSSSSNAIEIRPDIDYFALSRQQEQQQQSDSYRPGTASSPVPIPARSSSLSQSLRRNSTIRRSIRLFRPSSTPPMSVQRSASLSKPVYHEIVVHGYGNGTNTVYMDPSEPPKLSLPLLDSESPPALSSASPASSDSGETLEDSIKTPSPTEQMMDSYFPTEIKPLRTKRVTSMIVNPPQPIPPRSLRRPRSTTVTSHASYSSMYEQLVEEQRRTFFADHFPAPAKPELTVDTNTHNLNTNIISPTTTTKKRHTMLSYQTVEDDWLAMEAFMDVGKKTHVMSYDDDDADVRPAWEQYSDLGGLTEVR